MRIYCSLFFLSLLSLTTGIGCTAYKTTIVDHDSQSGAWSQQPPIKGVPTTVSVLSHMRFDVIEHYYLVDKTDSAAPPAPAPAAPPAPAPAAPPASVPASAPNNGANSAVGWLTDAKAKTYRWRTIKMTPIQIEKVIFVDPKRPFSGTVAAANLTFKDTTQHLSQVDYDVTDNTIRDIATIVKNYFPSGLIKKPGLEGMETDATGGVSGAFGGDISTKLVQVDSVVASTILNVNDCNFDACLQHFLWTHSSQCHNCSDVVRTASNASDDEGASIGRVFFPPPAPAESLELDLTNESFSDAQ